MSWGLAPIADFAGFLSGRHILAVAGLAGLVSAAVHVSGRAPEARSLPAAAMFAWLLVTLLVLLFLAFASSSHVAGGTYRFPELALSNGVAVLLFALCSLLLQSWDDPRVLSPAMLILMLVVSAVTGLLWPSMLILHRAIRIQLW